MSRASTSTLLSLDKYSSVLGLTPSRFNQGVSAIIFPDTSCGDVVYQYAWQSSDNVSREEIATEIAKAESDLADYLGWWAAPTWIAQDARMYPRPYRPDYYDVGGYNVRYQQKGIKTRYGKIIEPGQRAVTLLTGPVLAFSDADGDGFNETATVTVATTLTNECEVKVYFDGHNGDPEWEIRPPRTKAIAGAVFTATFWAWQLIDPAFWEAIPTAITPDVVVNLDGAVYVTRVNVYREYNDPTATSATFYWEPQPCGIESGACVCECCGGTGCEHCTLVTQDGCAHIRDAELGLLVPMPGTYDADNGAWGSDEWSVCRDPDQVKLYYYCGDLSWLNLAGRRCDGLSDEWARIIAWLATARLKRPICACGSAGALVDWLQTDAALDAGGGRYTVLWQTLDNPFGTRNGELAAWHYVSQLARNSQQGAGAV